MCYVLYIGVQKKNIRIPTVYNKPSVSHSAKTVMCGDFTCAANVLRIMPDNCEYLDAWTHEGMHLVYGSTYMK